MAVTHHQQIAISGTAQFSGPVIGTGSGKQSSLTKLNVSGTVGLSGRNTLATLVITSAANAYSGKRYIGTASLLPKTVANTRVRTTTRIQVTPQVIGSPVGGPKAWVSSITSGTGFGVKLAYGATPTGMTGTVHWNIVTVL